MTEHRDSAISRWSRLKQREKRRGAKPEETPGPVAGQPPEEGGPLSGQEADEAAIVEQLPDIETLEEGSDFTVFLKEGVPEALRRQALRKLWRLNPVFANLDGLNDYDEDFTIVTTLAENLKTVYQVGKGMPDPEPDPESAEEQEDGPEHPGDQAEATESKPSLETSEPEAVPADPSGDGEAPASSKPPLTAAPMERVEEREPERIRDDSKKSGSSAARRRWSGFTS